MLAYEKRTLLGLIDTPEKLIAYVEALIRDAECRAGQAIIEHQEQLAKSHPPKAAP